MKNRATVCVVGTRGFPDVQGGVEKHCESIYPLLNSHFDFIVYRRSPYIHSSQQYPHIRFVDLPSTQIKGFEAFFHSFIATIGSCFTRARIVHYHNIGPGMFAPIVRLFGKKVVMTYHSANYEHAKWGKVAKLWLMLSEQISLKASNAIIFVNRFQMEKYPQGIRQKSYYIPNGVPDAKHVESTQYIKTLGLESRKYVLGVGRITPEKGFDVLIKAFERLDTDYKLVIVGGVETESGYFKELKRISASGRVVFAGYNTGEKLCELYSHAALYVLSSLNEGFPLVLLEAMKYGLDVLISDMPATRLVKLYETDYFENGNVKDLANKLSLKLSEPQKREYDLSAYNWEKIAMQVEEIYRKCLR